MLPCLFLISLQITVQMSIPKAEQKYTFF